MATEVDMLAGVPFFALLSAEERAMIAERVDLVSHKAGVTLFRTGDPGGRLFVVRSGIVELYVRTPTGERIVLETVGPGDFFGELSLLDGGARSASAEVKEDLEALAVDRSDLDAVIHLRPEVAMGILAATGRRLRESSRLLRSAAARNINDETEDKRTFVMRVADWIAEFSGSLRFLFLHLVWFATWISLNLRPLSSTRLGGFDLPPFGLLTLVVSLEAIILSVFVLLSQNRQVARDRVRNDIEYEVNLRAESEVTHLHDKVDHLQVETLARLQRIEAQLDTLSATRSARSAAKE
jgi:uncharacterized membrane protein